MLLPVSCVSIKSHVLNSSQKNADSCGAFCVQSKPANISFQTNSGICRFGKVDETIYRGGRPELEQMPELKDIGITTIVDLSTEKSRITGYTEKNAAKGLGMIYVKIPIASGFNPSDSDIDKFFETIENAKKNNEKVFVHCLEGKDRTGLFVELYKIKYGLSDAQNSINTLIKSRYNFSENPLAINLIKEFAEKIKTKV